jgi:hypothetical protein
LGDSLIVEFDATNHSRTPITKPLKISVGIVRYGSKQGGPRYTPLEDTQIDVSLAPAETKHLRQLFSQSERVPRNGAEVTVLK